MAKAASTDTAATDAVATTLPASITLNAYYAGFTEQGVAYRFDEDSVVTDPDFVAYFVGREGARFTVNADPAAAAE